MLVTVDIPKNIKVFKVTNKAFFPPNMQKTIKEEIHIWIIMDHPDGQQMSHVPLPYSRPTKITLYVGSVITRLKLPYKVSISNLHAMKVYVLIYGLCMNSKL